MIRKKTDQDKYWSVNQNVSKSIKKGRCVPLRRFWQTRPRCSQFLSSPKVSQSIKKSIIHLKVHQKRSLCTYVAALASQFPFGFIMFCPKVSQSIKKSVSQSGSTWEGGSWRGTEKYQEASMEYQDTFMEYPGAFMEYHEDWSERGYYGTSRSF